MSNDQTDERLAEMEKRLTEIYQETESEIQKKSRDFFEAFKKSDESMKNKLENNKITQKEYDSWRKGEIFKGARYKRLQNRITNELANVNKTALAYVNGELPEIYALNYNATGTTLTNVVNKKFNAGISFDLVDRDTVRYLATKDRTLLPAKKLDIAKDKLWNTKKMQSELLQGIIQGESVYEIAARLENVTGMNCDSAVRNARTMVMGARNRGHLDAMEKSKSLGIVTEKEWMAYTDARTREEHQKLNGKRVDADKPFEVDGYEIMYPGDPSAAPEMVYNCRCRIVEHVVGFIDPDTGNLKKL